MAGEFQAAKQCIEQALESAAQDPGMSADTMASALLTTLLSRLMKSRARKDLMSLIEFELEAAGEDEFVITRGS